MPLDVGKLSHLLQDVLARRPKDALAYAREFASAYDAYARDALAGAGVPLVTGLEVAAMVPAVAAAHVTPTTPVAVASGMVAGVTLYWASSPVVFGPPPLVGVAAPPLGGPVAIPALAALLAVPNPSVSVVASAVGALLDALTRTVLVTYAAPVPAGPFPLV